MSSGPQADRAEIARALALLYEPGDVVELRVPKTRHGTLSGYFDDFDALADHAARLSGTVAGVYVTLNPVKSELLARAVNRVERYAKVTTSDADILARHWMLFDFDPRRASGISASDAEHEAALTAARSARTWLTTRRGFPAESLVLADSANGAHLLARVALENTLAATSLVRRCLEAVALHCNTADVMLDTTVHNAARIGKLYGTLGAKGDGTPARPHRLSRLLEIPT